MGLRWGPSYLRRALLFHTPSLFNDSFSQLRPLSFFSLAWAELWYLVMRYSSSHAANPRLSSFTLVHPYSPATRIALVAFVLLLTNAQVLGCLITTHLSHSPGKWKDTRKCFYLLFWFFYFRPLKDRIKKDTFGEKIIHVILSLYPLALPRFWCKMAVWISLWDGTTPANT